MLLVFTFNWYVHYFHVVVGLLFPNLVARKTHSYYAVELDGRVLVLGSTQTVVGFVVDPCTVNYCPLLTRDDFVLWYASR